MKAKYNRLNVEYINGKWLVRFVDDFFGEDVEPPKQFTYKKEAVEYAHRVFDNRETDTVCMYQRDGSMESHRGRSRKV